ncbi:MAG: cellulase family glycosylhydrolase [Myxococcaceae bacterium]|nr:cellulase family glycosylhydrolase [Myxococcaceae bacterium]
MSELSTGEGRALRRRALGSESRLLAAVVATAAVPREVQRWQDYCRPFRRAAERSLANKLTLPFPPTPLPGGTSVQDVVRTGARSPVYVGGASRFPGSENQPVYFQNFTKAGNLVQLYAYSRKNGEWVSFDISGDLARAYSSEHFTSGQAGTNSVLGLPSSGRQILNPSDASDWHVTAFRGTPEVQALLQSNTAFGYQEFEGGVLVELGGGRVQAFRFDGETGAFRAMGTPFPEGRIEDGGFPPVTRLPGAVSVQAGHFSLNGQPFRHVGANLSQVLYEKPDRMWQELEAAKNAGVQNVRVFLPNSALSPREVGDRLEVMLSQANALGLKVTVSLSSFARQEFYTETESQFMGGHNGTSGHDFSGAFAVVKGDERFYDWLHHPDGSLALGHPVVQPSFFEGGYVENYKPFVEQIVTRFKDNPAVFSWEVANETKFYGTRTDQRPDYGPVKAFYEDMTATIRRLAPRQMVTAGLTNSREFVGDDVDARREFLRLFDYVSIHQYVDLARGVRENQESLDTDVALARELGRPVVLGEFGFHSGTPTPQQVDDYLRHAQDVWGVDSVTPWAAGSQSGIAEQWWVGYGIDRFHQQLRDTAARYQAWNMSH